MEEDWALALGQSGWKGTQAVFQRAPQLLIKRGQWAPGEQDLLSSREKADDERIPLK